jgi:hypothetical protein
LRFKVEAAGGVGSYGGGDHVVGQFGSGGECDVVRQVPHLTTDAVITEKLP